MHVCALGNVIGRTCREYAAGAVHDVRIANISYVSRTVHLLGSTTSLLQPQLQTRGIFAHAGSGA